MSGSQIAHNLKLLGNGSEAAGVVAVYRAGKFVGAAQALTAAAAAYCVYRLGRWGWDKLTEYLQARGYAAADEAV